MSQYYSGGGGDKTQFMFDGKSVCLGICGESVHGDQTKNENWKIISNSNLEASAVIKYTLCIYYNPIWQTLLSFVPLERYPEQRLRTIPWPLFATLASLS